MRRDDDMPMITVDHCSGTPGTFNPPGVTGCGEAGVNGGPWAVANAMIDAPRRGGYTCITRVAVPVTPWRVRAAMNG